MVVVATLSTMDRQQCTARSNEHVGPSWAELGAIGKSLNPGSMAYLHWEGLLASVGRNIAFQDRLIATLGLRSHDAPFAATPSPGRNDHCDPRVSSNYCNDDNQQRNLNERDERYVILWPMGPVYSRADHRSWSESDSDGCRCGSDQETACETRTGNSVDLPAMSHTDQPI
jgi:hypothetical protein